MTRMLTLAVAARKSLVTVTVKTNTFDVSATPNTVAGVAMVKTEFPDVGSKEPHEVAVA